jgi:hypothetical protein
VIDVRPWRVPLLTGLFVLLVCALTNSGFDVTEGSEDLTLAARLIDAHTVAFDADPGGTSAPGPDGRFYLSHEAGNALPLLPVVWLTRHPASGRAAPLTDSSGRMTAFLASFVPAVYNALLVAVFCHLLQTRFGFDARTAATASLALGLATILLPYARMLFDGVLAGLLILAAVSLAIGSAQSGRIRVAACAGACLGAAIAVRQTAMLIAPSIALYLLAAAVKHRRRVLPAALALAAGMAPFLVWQGWYNAVRTGSPLVPAVALTKYLANNALDGNMLVGVVGLLVSPGKSMLLFSPPLVLSLLGARAFWRERRAEAVLVAGAVVPFLAMHAAARNWAGDWGWGPRYTVTVMPLLFLPAAWTLRAAHHRQRVRAATLLALGAGLLVQTTATIVNWHYIYAYQFQLGRWSKTRAAWSMADGQFATAAATALRNLLRLCGGAWPEAVVAGADPLNVAASNSINVWWLTALRAGESRLAVCGFVAAALTAAVWTAWRLSRHLAPPSRPSPRLVEPTFDTRPHHA